MTTAKPNLIQGDKTLNLELLQNSQEKPVPFTPGEPLFWDDPHISAQMLSAHLDPGHDAASRRPETIERSVAWIIKVVGLHSGDRVLDLGCGPGLYTSRFAALGMKAVGVDYSQRSIAYAREQALELGLDIEYRYQNYLELTDINEYNMVTLIYGDYCVLSPQQRTILLQKIQQALKPGGYFVFDVTTRELRKRHGNRNRWYISEAGFWKPGRHLVLEEGFDYPDQSVYLDQYSVVEENGALSVYRNWFQDYTRETIAAEVEASGFTVQDIWSDLVGTEYQAHTEWLGVIARKTAY